MLIGDGGGLGEATAPFTFQGAEPTITEFVAGRPEQATRFLYTADASGIGFSLVVGSEALKFPDLIRTVAGQWSAALDADALVPGVADIAETQEVKPLGSLEDVFQVAIESTSGKSSTIPTFKPTNMFPEPFAATVAYWRGVLDSWETPAA